MARNRTSGDVEQVPYERVGQTKATLEREDGQTMAEYAMVLAVTAISVVAAITLLSGGIAGAINNVTSLV